MGFFAEFSQWLNRLLATYIGDTAAHIAGALEPAVVTLGTLYVMGWGYLQMSGQVEEPVTVGFKRIALLVIVLGAGLRLWLYNTVVVDTFYSAPMQLGAVVIGAYDPVTIVDQIIFTGGDAASALIEKGGIFHGNFSYYLAGFAVYLIVGVTAIYTIFLLSLSHIALSILLAIGPLFIVLALFNSTRRFLEAWIAQLANYALMAILTVLTAALMMTLLTTATQQAAAKGGGIQIADAVGVCMAAGLTFLMMRQVMPMAAGLASGVSLSTFGVVSAALLWAGGSSTRSLGNFARGLSDGDTSRWDPLSRKAGFALKSAATGSTQWLVRRARPNTVRPSAS
jgi:type IV secretion system protein VirB6